MQDFRRLAVWQKSHQLTLAVYETSAGFPSEERYGLTSQIRRSAMSVPSNIAEGCGRETNSELRRFLYIAMGSASELDYQLLLAHDLKIMESTIYHQLRQDVVEIKRMLTGLIQKLTTDN